MADQPAGCPSSEVDLWADDVLGDPWPSYAALRAAGPVVWLSRHGLAALPRYGEVHAVLADWRRFSSAQGVGVSDMGNGLGESIIASDPPNHTDYRRVLVEQLTSGALSEPEVAEVSATATRFAEGICRAGTFDAVADLARPYSLTVVADLLGLPPAGREDYPGLAERAFNLFGPDGPRVADGLAAFAEILQRAVDAPGSALVPGRRADRLCRMERPLSLISYTWPGIDTTVNGLASALVLFARHPDAWAAIRADRSLIPGAFAEVLRLHTPVQYFTRWVTESVSLNGVELPAGTRVLLMYGSANRDERRFPDPDRFDIRRPEASSHLAFGRGIHLCVGMHLARLEAHSLLEALADRVVRFEAAGELRWLVNNTLHGPAVAPLRAILD
ncbi:MAG TPA: cytochrome P450 [Acidimicrobiia bacterium]|nr:cytochrome P450 [Acidimicrobiia bacterium]